MFEYILDIFYKIFMWIFGIFLNPQQHEIQKLIWSVVASLFVVLIVYFIKKPKLKFFNKNLIIQDYITWKKGKLWKLKISLKNTPFSYSVNNLKVFYYIYDNEGIEKVKLQAGSDDNPLSEPEMQDSDYDNEGLNFARGESNNFHLIIRTNNKQFYEGKGKTEIPPDYWIFPCEDSLYSNKYSKPTSDNKFVFLDDGIFFVEIKIRSDQLVSDYLFKLILKDKNVSLVELNFMEKIKYRLKNLINYFESIY